MLCIVLEAGKRRHRFLRSSSRMQFILLRENRNHTIIKVNVVTNCMIYNNLISHLTVVECISMHLYEVVFLYRPARLPRAELTIHVSILCKVQKA